MQDVASLFFIVFFVVVLVHFFVVVFLFVFLSVPSGPFSQILSQLTCDRVGI